jgi:hypothetical protein
MVKYNIRLLEKAGKKRSPNRQFMWYKGYAQVFTDSNEIVVGRYRDMIKGKGSKGKIEYIGGIYTDKPSKSKNIKNFCKSKELECIF